MGSKIGPEELQAKAEDAEAKASQTGDVEVSAAWRNIADTYRELARRALNEDAG